MCLHARLYEREREREREREQLVRVLIKHRASDTVEVCRCCSRSTNRPCTTVQRLKARRSGQSGPVVTQSGDRVHTRWVQYLLIVTWSVYL